MGNLRRSSAHRFTWQRDPPGLTGILHDRPVSFKCLLGGGSVRSKGLVLLPSHRIAVQRSTSPRALSGEQLQIPVTLNPR